MDGITAYFAQNSFGVLGLVTLIIGVNLLVIDRGSPAAVAIFSASPALFALNGGGTFLTAFLAWLVTFALAIAIKALIKVLRKKVG